MLGNQMKKAVVFFSVFVLLVMAAVMVSAGGHETDSPPYTFDQITRSWWTSDARATKSPAGTAYNSFDRVTGSWHPAPELQLAYGFDQITGSWRVIDDAVVESPHTQSAYSFEQITGSWRQPIITVVEAP